jgi:probable HAF family extracellular repeat protein
MVPLGDLLGGDFFSLSRGISGDGTVVIGDSESALGVEAVRGTNAGGSMVGLGDLAGGDYLSFGHGVSNDGLTVVGTSWSALGVSEAFVWTGATGMAPLGDLPDGNFLSNAWAVSGDGSIVVGTGTPASNIPEAFVWTLANGMQSLMAVATSPSQGATIPAGWTLHNAYGISADGSRIVGDGTNPDGDREAWLITGLQLQDDDNDGVINIEDNCINVPNGPLIPDAGGNSQYDSNGDNYGNACDADFNGDLVVNGLDVGTFVGQFGTIGPDADLNGDGVVNGLDVGTFVNAFGQAPGPSGTAP